MVKRKIVKIDEDKCTGCGLCVPNCQEGALQIIDGKARLISDLFCDGLGACIGHCPEDAITIEEREAEPYDEKKVMEVISKQGTNTIKAHLDHLKEHNQNEFYDEAIQYLEDNNIEMPNEVLTQKEEKKMKCSCPGAKMMDFSDRPAEDSKIGETGETPSQLRQWPIQLHLVSPNAPYFQGSDVLLAADCTAFALGNFHRNYLKGKSLAIACPKLDSEQDIYVDKIISLINDAKIDTLTVATMEVPCCNGLLSLAKSAADKAKRNMPIKSVVVSIQGRIIKEEWI